MIAHTSLSVRHYPKAKAFYSAVLAPLGYSNNMEYGESAGFNDGRNTDLWISQSDTVVPTHLAFQARSREEVHSFCEATSRRRSITPPTATTPVSPMFSAAGCRSAGRPSSDCNLM
jgi:hypothetical protein